MKYRFDPATGVVYIDEHPFPVIGCIPPRSPAATTPVTQPDAAPANFPAGAALNPSLPRAPGKGKPQ